MFKKTYAPRAKARTPKVIKAFKRLEKMSQYQEDICEGFANHDGNIIVRARAGTGKTSTIMEAIFRIPAGRKVLLAAFNKKIADELSDRLASCQELLQASVEAKTSHSLGLMFLREGWGKVDMGSVAGKRALYMRGEWIARTVLGKLATDDLVRKIKDLAAKCKAVCPFGTVEDAVQVALDFGIIPDSLSDYTVNHFGEWAMECLKLAQERMTICYERNNGAYLESKAFDVIDYDDMIFIPLVKGFARPMYDDIVIDEAQDMNFSQIELIIQACRNNPNL